jgi:hypothetical protein
MGSRAKSRRFLRAVTETAPRFISTTNLAATVSPSISIAFVARVYTGGTWTEGTATQGCDRSADPGPEWGRCQPGVSKNSIRLIVEPPVPIR